MHYFLVDAQGRRIGPYAREELAFLRSRALVGGNVPVVIEGDERLHSLDEALAAVPAGRGPWSIPPRSNATMGSDATPRSVQPPSATQDFLRLAPHLMLPLGDIRALRWFDNRRILALALVGLIPLVLMLYLQTAQDLGGAIWGVALYSSLLWALFFYVAFSQPEVTVGRCVITFAGSALFSIGLVALARYVVPFTWVLAATNAPGLASRWTGHLLGVAFIEELAKLFMLYFLWPARLRPHVMMFYGLMAGLGFGIYEGVAYQSSYNLQVSFPQGALTREGAGIYYMLNILRLTSLPFLHAMWTGIAGYFIGLAGQFPQRPGGLLLAAVVVPSTLHATYNTFSHSLAGLTIAILSVLALNLYLIKGQDFERIVGDRYGP